MSIYPIVTLSQFGLALNVFNLVSPIGIGIACGVLVFFTVYYLLQRQISQRRRTELILRQQTERERLVNQIAQQIRQSLNLEEVLATTVAEVKTFLECDRVLIYRIWGDGTGSAITETVLPSYPTILGVTFPEEVFPSEYHQAYIEGKSRALTNVDQADVESCLREFVKQFGVKAKLVVPIIQEIRSQESGNHNSPSLPNSPTPPSPYLWGLLIAHQCSQTRQWQHEEIELMKQLANQVAIAIQQSELYEQLQKLNEELEHRVQQRTEELARTNDSLRHTNQTLQSLIAASPRAIFTLDLQDKVKIWNPAAERMFGWTEAEVIDRTNPVISGDNFEEYQEIKQTILQGITPSSLEIQRQKKDGSPIEIVFSAAPLTNREGEINGLVAVVADITEQKRQAEQVRLLQSVVLNTNDAILITEAEPIDEPGPRILYVNEAFTRMTGYTLEEVLGKTPRILQGSKSSRAKLDKVRAALSRWKSITVEVINYRKDGSEFWVEFGVVPVANKMGRYTHWISVQRDITERKRTEEALRQSEERFRRVVENALDIITILDADGTIHYESPSVEKVLGYSPTELMGKNFFAYIHPDDLANACAGIIKAIRAPLKTRPIEFRCQHQDGSWRTLEAISQQFIDDAPAPRIMVNSRDITERKRLDEVRLALEREKELSTPKEKLDKIGQPSLVLGLELLIFRSWQAKRATY
jgi:PAS domain S-box-containing protein